MRPLLLLFGLVLSFSALRAQIEWNPLIGYLTGQLAYDLPTTPERAGSSVRPRNGWVVGIDVRSGGGKFFFVPGLRYQRLSYEIPYANSVAGELLFRDGDIQLLTVPIGLAYRLRPAHTSFNLNLHAGLFYQLELSQTEVTTANDGAIDWHPDSAYGARLGLGLDLDWLTFHLNYFPQFGQASSFMGSGNTVGRSLAVGVRF